MVSDLSRAIMNEHWGKVKEIAEEYPRQATVWSKGSSPFDSKRTASLLPLHEALVVGNAPVDCINALVRANPSALQRAETSFLRLPLHCACRKNANLDILTVLANACPEACVQPDSLGRVPLFYAISNGARLEVVALLLQTNPAAARAVDRRHWTPASVACSVGADPRVVTLLLRAHPEAVLIPTRRGTHMSRYIPRASPHYDELTRLVRDTTDYVETTVALPTVDLPQVEQRRRRSLTEAVMV